MTGCLQRRVGRPANVNSWRCPGAIHALLGLAALVGVQACAGDAREEADTKLQLLALSPDEVDGADATPPGSIGGGGSADLDGPAPRPGDAGSADAAVPDTGPLGGGTIVGLAGGPGGLLGGPGDPVRPQAFGHWKFDDCGPSGTLQDSSPSAAHAVRSAEVTCAEGPAGGRALLFDEKRDRVSVAPNAAFAVSERVALSAWLRPQPGAAGAVISKEANGAKAFELLVQNGNVVFRIDVDNGRKVRQVASKAPIQQERWTHVAAQFDGSFVRLFKDGVQVGQVAASGRIADVNGSIQIGNNLQKEVFKGRIDEVWLSSALVTADDFAAQSCVRQLPTLSVSPTRSGLQDAGRPFTYKVSVANRDVGGCQQRDVFPNTFIDQPGFRTVSIPSDLALAPGQSGQMDLQVSHNTDAAPGTLRFPVQVAFLGREGPPDGPFDQLEAMVEYTVNEPTGCFVRTSRELLIRDLSVVEDPLRTSLDGPVEDPRAGAWTFGRLMEQLAPSDAEGPDLVEHMFSTWLTDQSINGFTVSARPLLRSLVLDSWPRTPDGKLDLRRAPLRLLAIVNRIDSRNLAQGHAGEGRFVFGVLDPSGGIEQFTLIFEYRLPASTTADVQRWADRWHALGALAFPSEAYNAALQDITDDFTRRGADPSRTTGSALAQLRSNEVALQDGIFWELREFELSGETHRLEPVPVKLTPDRRFQRDSALIADFINQNEDAVLRETHEVPLLFQAQSFLGGSSFNDLGTWTASGIKSSEARHKFALNTCNGCHSLQEANTGFLHVHPRLPGRQSVLSPFMEGTVVTDIVTGAPRQLNDLQRRNDDLQALVCRETAPARTTAAQARSAAPSSREQFLAKGIDRTH